MTLPVIFIDECIGGKLIAAGLREHGIEVRIQDELAHIPRRMEDRHWARAVAQEGWIAITRDKGIRRRIAEKQAVAEAGLALFVLTSRRNLTRDEIIRTIAAAAPKIPHFLMAHDPPLIAAIHSNGKIELREKL